MPAYKVVQAAGAVGPRVFGADTAIVFAADAASARMQAALISGFDAKGLGLWAGATVTEIAVGANMDGWTARLTFTDPVTPFTVITGTYVGTGGQTIDQFGTALATAIEAFSGANGVIEGAAYTTGTNVMTAAETTDGIGDWNLEVLMFPPGVDITDPANADTTMVVSVTDGGAAGDALAFTLANTIPATYGLFKSAS